MMAALLQTLDSTIVNVALPTIEGNIGASIDAGTWIITGYIISNVVTIRSHRSCSRALRGPTPSKNTRAIFRRRSKFRSSD